jgi:hypothetical protein
MNLPSMLDHAAPAVHSASEIARSLPNNPWSMSAFAAAAGIMVTLVTIYLWPNERATAPVREATTAGGVLQLFERGVATADIARRTGMSHDAVATIVRAGARAGDERGAVGRKSQPSAA